MQAYKIDLDNSGELIPQIDNNGKELSKILIKDIEIKCVIDLLNMTKREASLSDWNNCQHLIDELEDYPKDKNFVVVSKEELKLIETGFDKSAKIGRPNSWHFAKNIFTQLEKPNRYIEPKPEQTNETKE